MPGDDEIVMIELLDEQGEHDGGDVAFGMGRRRASTPGEESQHRRKVALGLLGAVALGGAIWFVGRNDKTPADRSPAVTSASAPVSGTTIAPQGEVPPLPPFTDTAADGTAATEPPTVAPTTVFDAGVGQIIPTDTSVGLYVTSEDHPDRVLRLDMGTGIVSETAEPAVGRAHAVLAGADGLVVVDDRTVGADAYNVVISPDGTVWKPNQAGDGIEQIDPVSGNLLRSATPPPGSLFGAAVVGVLADGRPVVIGPDIHAYAVGADNTFERIGDGFLLGAQPGGYWESSCDPTAVCQMVIHGVGQPVLSLPSIGDNQTLSVTMAPSGRFALVVTDGRPAILDLATGTPTDLQATGLTAPNVGNYFGQPAVGLWYGPDDRYVMFPTDNNVGVYDTTTGELRVVPLPDGVFNPTLLGFAP